MSEISNKQDIKIPLWARIVSWILGGLIYLTAMLIVAVGSWNLGKSVLNEIGEFGLMTSLAALGLGLSICLISALLAMLLVGIWKHVIGVKRL